MNSKVIVPTIGRKVWYWHGGVTAKNAKRQPMDATVCFVHNERLVNLGCRDHKGASFNATGVPLLQPGDPTPDEGVSFCEWMEYQKGQATKTEKLETALEAARRIDSAGDPLINSLK